MTKFFCYCWYSFFSLTPENLTQQNLFIYLFIFVGSNSFVRHRCLCSYSSNLFGAWPSEEVGEFCLMQWRMWDVDNFPNSGSSAGENNLWRLQLVSLWQVWFSLVLVCFSTLTINFFYIFSTTHIWIVCVLLSMFMLESFPFYSETNRLTKVHCYNEVTVSWHSIRCRFVVQYPKNPVVVWHFCCSQWDTGHKMTDSKWNALEEEMPREGWDRLACI